MPQAHKPHAPHALHLRQRSTAAVVLSRADAPAPGADASPTCSGAAATPAVRRRRWPIVLTWIALGSAIAALWAVLLIGDSLRASG
jgi:hypothetical protein